MYVTGYAAPLTVLPLCTATRLLYSSSSSSTTAASGAQQQLTDAA
jgi:hypothetical protein